MARVPLPLRTHSRKAHPSSGPSSTYTASSGYIRPRKSKAHTAHSKLFPGEHSQGTEGRTPVSISVILGAEELPPTHSVEMLILPMAGHISITEPQEGKFPSAVACESTCSRPRRTTANNLEMASSQRCLRRDKALRVDLSRQDCVLMTHRGRTG